VVLSIRVPEPQFEGQTKGKLGNSEVKGLVETIVNEQLMAYLDENPGVGKVVVGKALDSVAGARGRPQGAGAGPPQERVRRRRPAGQARRLPGARPQVRALPGRG
jgi:DNA gyrase subunit B